MTLRVGFFTTLTLNDSFIPSALAVIVTLPGFFVSKLPKASKSATDFLLDVSSTSRFSRVKPEISKTSTKNSVIVPTYNLLGVLLNTILSRGGYGTLTIIKSLIRSSRLTVIDLVPNLKRPGLCAFTVTIATPVESLILGETDNDFLAPEIKKGF